MNITEIIDSYNDSIDKITTKFFRNPLDKEEAKQDALVKIWKGLKTRKAGNIKAWVNTISANACRDYLRLKKNKFDFDEESTIINIKDTSETIEANLLKQERQKIISKAIYNLPNKYKDVIILYEIDDLSYEEISKKINVPIGTIKSRLYSARKILFEKLEHLTK